MSGPERGAMSEGLERQLSAVVFTSDWPDDERLLADFGGRLVGARGDGVLATFDNCHNAMLALVKAAEIVPFAAGLAFGEVTFEQDEAFSEAIVEAARLASVCTVGSVYATGLARAHLEGMAAQDRGPVVLKGLGPVEHHEFDLRHAAEAMASGVVSDRQDIAILSADIVASTDLLESGGTEAAIAVQRAFSDAIAASCDAGEVVHVHGDGVVVRFPSATGAIRAAIDLHQLIAEHCLWSGSIPFDLRSGVAAGADPEAEATALESSGEPGQIILSNSAQALAFDLAEEVVDGVLAPVARQAAPLPNELVVGDSLPLVGRASPLEALGRRWDETLAGQSSAAFVIGEAGIGKTRLVSTFAKACHDAGALVLFGASDMEMTAPYRPFVAALRTMQLDGSGDALIDRLRPLFPQAIASVDGRDAVEDDRTQLFDAVNGVLEGASQPRPVLLVLDDLHWSSSATIMLLRHLLLHPPDGRVMILGTFRDGEVDRSHPLFDVVNDQVIVERVARVPLQHLSIDDVAHLVGAHFASEVGDSERRLADRIHQESSGLPFFTGEVLRHLGDRPNGDHDEALTIPASVVDAIRQRLTRLDDATCRMLEVAATVGQAFDLEVVAGTLNTTLHLQVERVEAAERLNLVRESGRAGHYQFDHALVRSALLAGLSATRVGMIHQQIAESLERLPGDHNDALAHHWRQATGTVARQQAVRYLVLSAERDASALAWEAAKVRYDEAIDLASDDGVVELESVVAMHLARAKAMRASGDPDFLVAMQETGRLARFGGFAETIAQVAINSTKPGTWFANANEPDEHFIGLCEDALAAPDLDPTLRCRVLSTLAINLAFDSDRPRRRAMVGEAVEIARAVGDADLVASALIAQHLAFWDPSTLDDRAEIIEELNRLARRRDNPDHLFLSGFFRASMLLECGQVGEAREVLHGLDQPISRTRNFWFRFLVDRMQTALAVASCHPDAKTLVDKLFETSFETQADAAGTWGAQLGGLAIQTGSFGSMAGQLAAASDRSRGQGVWSCGLAISHIDAGDPDAARATLGKLKEAPHDFMWLVSQQMVAEAAYRLGDRDLSRSTLEHLRPYAGRVGVIASGTLVFNLVSISIGEAAIGAGESELAIRSLRAAVQQADELELPFFQVRSRRRLLEALPIAERGGDIAAEALEMATSFRFESEIVGLQALG